MRLGLTFRPRRGDLRAWSLYLGLAAPFAILAHLVFDVVDVGFTWAVLLRPAHIVLIALAAGATLAIAHGLGARLSGPERRRRLALVRASLQVDRRPLLRFIVATVVQTMIVAATVSLDGSTLHPQRLVLAVLAAVLAVVASGLAIHVAERHVLDLILCAPRRAGLRRLSRAVRVRALRSLRPYSLFRPNRAPPLLTDSI